MSTCGKRTDPEENPSVLLHPAQKRISSGDEKASVEDTTSAPDFCHMEMEDFPISEKSSVEGTASVTERTQEPGQMEIEHVFPLSNDDKSLVGETTSVPPVEEKVPEEEDADADERLAAEEFLAEFLASGRDYLFPELLRKDPTFMPEGAPEIDRDNIYELTHDLDEERYLSESAATRSHIFLGETSKILEDGSTVSKELIVELWSNDIEESILWMAQLKLLLDKEIANHPNIPDLSGCCKDGGIVALVYDCDPLSILPTLIPDGVRFPYSMRIKVALQLAELLHFLHSQNPPVIICNLEAGSIIIDKKYKPIVCGLGMASSGSMVDRAVQDEYVKPRSIYSRYYTDRHYLLTENPEPMTDVYSLGCLIIAMLTMDQEILLEIPPTDEDPSVFDNILRISESNFIDKKGCYKEDLAELVPLAIRCMDIPSNWLRDNSWPDRPSAREVIGILNGLRIVQEANLSTEYSTV